MGRQVGADIDHAAEQDHGGKRRLATRQRLGALKWQEGNARRAQKRLDIGGVRRSGEGGSIEFCLR